MRDLLRSLCQRKIAHLKSERWAIAIDLPFWAPESLTYESSLLLIRLLDLKIAIWAVLGGVDNV
jgi:hypothetical protein